jgi:hypothetical protein
MNNVQLTQTLAESFNALADEVQSLIDHKTILEHKLRFAHEQVSQRQSSCTRLLSQHVPPFMMNNLSSRSVAGLRNLASWGLICFNF